MAYKGIKKTNDTLRASKAIMTFGPGSIYDLPNGGSVMMLGIDFWPNHIRIDEPRLARFLGVDHFGQPSNQKEGCGLTGIPAMDYPRHRVCVKCKRLMRVESLIDGGFCPYCNNNGTGKKLPGDLKKPNAVATMPPRLIMACRNGHVEEFPWKQWLGCDCTDPELYLEGNNSEIAESDMRIRCGKCGKIKDFSGALKTHPDHPCHGERPWLADREDGCTENLKGVMRGSSSVYYPFVASSLLIPPFSDRIHDEIRPFLTIFRDNYLEGTLEDNIRPNKRLKDLMKKNEYSMEQILKAFEQAYTGRTGSSNDGIKADEYESLTHDLAPNTSYNLVTEELELTDRALSEWFTSVRRVVKLKEIIALRGFTRVEPFMGNEDVVQKISHRDRETFLETIRYHKDVFATYSQMAPESNWLPGVELTGEGIFFELNKKRLEEWEAETEQIERYVDMRSSNKNTILIRDGADLTLNRTVLIHSLSHQMIRRISLDCGYGSASLRERIYSTIKGVNSMPTTMGGFLIYTSTSDSEGTMGGLIAQAESERTLLSHIRSSLESMKVCSQDPLCGNHDPSMTKEPWGASCHSCMHLPETSCEGLQNRLLDRYCLIGNDETPGYFYEN